MKIIKQEIITYESIDGIRFDTEGRCKVHEAEIPLSTRYRLENKITDTEWNCVGLYEVGFTNYSYETIKGTPGFLLSGEDYKITHASNHSFGLYQDTLKNIATMACENFDWWNENNKWIRARTINQTKNLSCARTIGR